MIWLVLAAALVTYASRAASVVLLPAPRGALRNVAERLPAPLFAGLAALTLLGPELAAPPRATLLAAGAALVAAPTRSLAVVLAAGLAAYGVGTWLW